MGVKLVRSSAVVWEELGAEVLLFIPTSGVSWMLNSAAAAVWKLCDGTRSEAELSSKLAASHAETAEFCRMFRKQGLLQMSGVGTTSAAAFGGQMNRDNMTGMSVRNLGSGGRKRPSPRGISGPA